MPIVRKVFKQGNSDVLAIPSYMLEAIGVNNGDSVVICSVSDLGIFIYKLDNPTDSETIH